MYIHRLKSLKEQLQGPAVPAVQTNNYEPFHVPYTNPATTDIEENPHQTLTPPEPDYELHGPYYSVIPAERSSKEENLSPTQTHQTCI